MDGIEDIYVNGDPGKMSRKKAFLRRFTRVSA